MTFVSYDGFSFRYFALNVLTMHCSVLSRRENKKWKEELNYR